MRQPIQNRPALFRLHRLATLVSIALALVALLATSCRKPSLSPEDAEMELRQSEWSRETRTTTLVLYRNLVRSAEDLLSDHPEIERFRSAGLVEIRPNSMVFGKPFGARAVLTAAGESAASAGWAHSKNSSDEDVYVITSATRQIDEIVDVVATGPNAHCDVKWRWQPTEVGRAVRVDSTQVTSQARFRLVKDHWELVDVLPL